MSYKSKFFIGVDLGKLRDHSALAVIERYTEKTGYDRVYHCDAVETRTVLRMIEQIRLGTSYPAVIDRICDVVAKIAEKGPCTVIVDATGVGQPVVDALRKREPDCQLIPVTITGGDQAHGLNIPKSDLLVSLQMMVANAELRIPHQLRFRKTLVEELTKIGRNLKAIGNGHDDLVMAVALACWQARQHRTIGAQGRRLL